MTPRSPKPGVSSTWVNSQWKFITLPGHFSAAINTQATLFGNEAPYRESTFGAVMKVNAKFGEVGLSGGYRHVYTSGHSDGYFASAYVGIPIP